MARSVVFIFAYPRSVCFGSPILTPCYTQGSLITPMRIAHILPYTEVGGTEIAQLNIMRACRKAGIDSLVVTLPGAVLIRSFFQESGIETITHPSPEPSLRNVGTFYRDSSAAAALLREKGVTAVHCANVLGGYHWVFAAHLAKLPMICHVRNRFTYLSLREKLVLRWIRNWVFVSQNSWTQFPMRVRPANGRVLYDGVSLAPAPASTTESVRAEFDMPPDVIVAGMFCRVAPQKDFETLIRAAAILAGRVPRLRYLIVGDYTDGPAVRQHYVKVESWLREHGVADRFVFAGFRRDVARLMQGCDISVLSTHEEGLPLVLLEAMTYARPTVATAVDGIPELIEDGKTGLLTPHGDAQALAAALERLAADPAMAGRLGEAGRRVVETKFSPAQFEQNVLEMYQQLVPSKR